MNGWVLSGFEQSYRRMGVSFHHTQYESQTYKLGKELVEEGLARGVLRRLDDGAVVCDLAQVGLKGEKVLLRSDGTSVYMTQDLGTAAERFDKYELDRLVYVVGDEQLYHFDVLFRVLGLLRPGLRRGLPPSRLRHDPAARGQDEEPPGHRRRRRRPDGRDAPPGPRRDAGARRRGQGAHRGPVRGRARAPRRAHRHGGHQVLPAQVHAA